ncbi:RagB/SusD family nutrient uptake outer membrane protein [Pedobacter alluvionis]|uniref:Putative outer membrane starch-binding protein n=1 Tax=Pedobacter alluvionis TaxID=475253 RepID=A0A497Y7W3_9SPHI|nr:RagB/SusD family nutrient uptake outer membrane protein [Pedobacter alluvionis]RLJ79573.1 putative outer membrane starch-binding protein [Pedobacter alluvionis]TFB30909.1 RagB/SusD family nutrient uptake outer membrane protein [Pedobacter alluvionis]
MKFRIFIIGLVALALAGCKKILEPEPENLKTIEQMYTDANFAQGFLINAYRTIPAYYDNSDFATDDAVTNQLTHPYLQLATGSWTAAGNPASVWNQSYEAMQYINLFLANSAKVKWAVDPESSKLFNTRMRGEAFGLRGLYLYFQLRNHGGVASNGQLTGVPIINQYQTATSDFNLPRASFDACVKQIYKDLDSAEAYLPVEYNDISSAAQIPARFSNITQNVETYNRVMGQYARQLFNGLIAKSFRARTALLAASPAFKNASNTVTWADAAGYAAQIIDYKGGANSLPQNGGTYYANTSEVDGLGGGNNPSEVIWRENIVTNDGTQEGQHFPPSLFGNGLMNPTQNLVEAFPMANGYPIDHPNANYLPANPYAGRDPRFAKYILFDGSTAGVSNTVIRTGSSSGSDNGVNVRATSTRTGYYMKKRLRMDVNRNPISISGKTHYNPRIRYTEMYLAYAEAANEAWGPTGLGTHAYSAYDIIKNIRKRAFGFASDPYLEECKSDVGKMRELIRNERRLELCFESFRFWDLRRWKVDLTKLNETARGMDVNGNVFTPLSVEPRAFQSYMYYGPIPNSEVLKYSQLIQNQGWK